MAFKFLEGLRCLNRRVLALLDVNARGCFHRRNKRAATNMPRTWHLQTIVSEKLMSKMIDTYRYHSIVFMYRTTPRNIVHGHEEELLGFNLPKKMIHIRKNGCENLFFPKVENGGSHIVRM